MNIIYLLYRKGPLLNGFGFWGGKENHEICSILTNIENRLWLKNQDECDILIQKHYESFEICIFCIIIFIVFYKILYFTLTYLCIVRPLLNYSVSRTIE